MFKKTKTHLKVLKLPRKLKEKLETIGLNFLFKKKEWEKKSLKTKNIKKRQGTLICYQDEHLNDQDLQKKKNKIYKIKYDKEEEKIDQEDSIILYLEEKLKHKKRCKHDKNKKDELDYLLDDLNRMENSKIKDTCFINESSDFDNLDIFKNKVDASVNHCSSENKEDNTYLSKKDINIFAKKSKENPYVVPSENNILITQDNILKNNKKDDTELIFHLRRKIKGLLNRLSESNMLSILNEVENLYNLNPRYFVNLELIMLLLTYITSQTTLKDSYLILYSGFVTALYRIIGIDFGAFFLQKLFKTFREFYSKESSKKEINDTIVSYNKECINLITVLSELYNFQVISCTLIYDLVRLFLNEITDLNTELLLKIILNSGSQLRHDDPSSLKDIVIIMHQKISETDLSTRTKFMIESIDNLKNNKIKSIPYNNRIQEDIFRMKKFLGTLSNRNSTRNTEPLRISLHDIESIDENDKWWHIGLPFKKERNSKHLTSNDLHEEKKKELLALAQSQRMNTDIRRSIFITIMSAEDFVDAFEKLLKLGLKKVQKLEIPRILLHCCGNEQSYNPYYAYIALRFCVKIHSIRTAFKFCLWDLFRSMGENDVQVIGNVNNGNLENIPLRRIVNLGKLYAFLVVNGGLDLIIFKKLNFFHLQPKTKTFVEVFFSTLILETQKGHNPRNAAPIQEIFRKLSSYPSLVEGIKIFLMKYLKNTEIFNLKEDKETFIWGSKKALEILDVNI
ncbi:unnamed protein product [Pneumocystis jirovecii]|uniref:MI domain-containing protein n=1 Tax=Pneumocystis jirovecii TaxID=42068 RepID=L0P7W4_PNEJI|nr:unnamed protein product [Pneumocystis jirovecii]